MPKVLCIEDEVQIRQDIVEELSEAGYETLQAANGAEGLKAICSEKPDLVLCDMTMPTMSGDQLLRTLREEHSEFDEIPFLFLTARADRPAMIEGRRLGADAYLTKPIDFELLLVEIESRLSQVNRMARVKQQEMVRLYRAMSKDEQPEPEPEPEPVLEDTSLQAIADSASLTYRQVKTVDGHLFPMSICAFDARTIDRMQALAPGSDNPDQFLTEVSLLLLSKVSEKIGNELEAGNSSLWITRIHFSTLRNDQLLRRFVSACAALADPVRRQLGLEIVGLPSSLLGTKVHEVATRTASLARIKILEIESEGLQLLGDLRTSFRLAALGAKDLARLAADKPEVLDRSLQKMRNKGIKLMVTNAEDPNLQEKLAHLDVDFFC